MTHASGPSLNEPWETGSSASASSPRESYLFHKLKHTFVSTVSFVSPTLLLRRAFSHIMESISSIARGDDKTTKRGCPLRDTLSAVSITQIITQIEVLRTGSIPSPAAESLISDLCFSGKHFHEVWSSMHCHPDRGSDCAHNS